LDAWHLPKIKKLTLSAPGGSVLSHELPLGGFGVSRYLLDDALAGLARQHQVDIYTNTRVKDIVFSNEHFDILTDKINVRTNLCMGAFGKRSNIDLKWKRPFSQQKANALNNFIGVKYHARIPHEQHVIALHNFRNGYCGISSIEDDKCCICYLTTAENLKAYGNSIPKMEKELLSKNPYLQEIFTSAKFLYEKPLTISQISFEKKEQVENHVLMLGDAAGLITPLCGNGMSMALHSSKLAAALADRFLQKEISRNTLELIYRQQWQTSFAGRLFTGRIIQAAFGKEWTTNLLVRGLRPFPSIVNKIIMQTHGEQPF
ncbi:MAG: pyridine nucleotide-disulfide oxidoreductase, partial [Chitinophagaceae bacterium]|nr:pyridine nucleotide-disulfide oxidoreductase [Chitinophagaceae bacterium]